MGDGPVTGELVGLYDIVKGKDKLDFEGIIALMICDSYGRNGMPVDYTCEGCWKDPITMRRIKRQPNQRV